MPLKDLIETMPHQGDGEPLVTENQRNLESGGRSLPRILLRHYTNAAERRKIESEGGLCVVIKVPTADWVKPFTEHLKWSWDATTLGRTGIERGISGPQDTLDRFLTTLESGGRYVAVSQDPEQFLPSAVIASADVIIQISDVPARTIAKAIQLATGRRCPPLPEAIAARLDFPEIAGAIRTGSTPRQCIDRLTAATRSRSSISIAEDAPLIEDLHGYGPAKKWALDLLTDVDLWRAGKLKFDDIERNVVLASDPGLGKTTFARSLAKSSGLPLVATSVGEWFGNSPGHLDSVIKQIDCVFASAISVAPAILFLDELDAIPDRRTLDSRGRDWWLPVITHLLAKLDGASSPEVRRLIVLGATNYANRIDPALIRPGRLSRVITIGLPSVPDLVGIYRQHLGSNLVGVDLTMIAELSRGSTGAEVMGYVKAAHRAARRAKRDIKFQDLLDIVAPSENRSVDDVWRVAVHEASHAVVGHLQGESIEAISIIRRGFSGGHTIRRIDASTLLSKRDIERYVRVALAGRCGEIVFLQNPCAGSGGYEGSDISEASRLIAMMHTSLGLGDSLVFRADADAALQALKLDKSLRDRVEAELRVLETETVRAIEKNRSLVERVARALVEHRFLDRERFLQFVGNPVPEAEHRRGKPNG